MRFTLAILATSLAASLLALPQTATAKEADAKAATSKKKITVASYKLGGAFPETAEQLGLFGELEPSLASTIARIDKAADAADVTGIILRIRTPSIGRGKIDELRAAIGRARDKGTRVYADLQMATGVDYLIACACNEIVMPPSGTLMVTGVRAEVSFYKGLLDKLGIQADFLQVGDFKGAAEPFTRTGMSAELRQQFESLIDDYYDQLVTTIAADRQLKPDQVRALVDTGLFTAEQARQHGLIDRVAYEDELKRAIRKQQKADTMSVVKNYGKKKVDTDFSGFTGMIKLMNLMMGNDTGSMRSGGDKIAVVYAIGAITSGESETGLLGGLTMGSDTIVKALRTAAKDDSVKAIVLRVDSPGGSALASDLIWREVVEIEKPVIASMGDVAASGGYYISMGANKIVAEPGTLTGSIGVVGGKLALGGMWGKVGIGTDVISRGKNSGIFSTETTFTAAEREALQQLMNDTYLQFTTKAADGRHMALDTLQALAQGKIYTGRQARKNGLVDTLGTLQDAILLAKESAGLDKDHKIQLLTLPKPKNLFEQLFGGPSIESRALATQLGTVAPQLAAPLREAELLRRLFQQPVNTVLPCRVSIR